MYVEAVMQVHADRAARIRGTGSHADCADRGCSACRKLNIPQEELFAEKSRRTAKHEKPLHTLQALHRMKSF